MSASAYQSGAPGSPAVCNSAAQFNGQFGQHHGMQWRPSSPAPCCCRPGTFEIDPVTGQVDRGELVPVAQTRMARVREATHVSGGQGWFGRAGFGKRSGKRCFLGCCLLPTDACDMQGMLAPFRHQLRGPYLPPNPPCRLSAQVSSCSSWCCLRSWLPCSAAWAAARPARAARCGRWASMGGW